MSDDDCDIFSAARKRIPEIALPKESYNLGNDSFSKEVDYDFIEDLPKKSTKTGKRKNPAATRENPPKSQEDASPPKQAGETEKDARKERSLSPVSLLILEMEKKNGEPSDDVGPVARRTRSSLNKTGIAPPPPPPVSATVEVPTQVKPKKRGKKKRTSKTTTTNNSVSVEASLPSIVGHLYQNKHHTSRRQTVAEVAARSKVVDSIDLVSAVAPRVEGFFNLDSEDEGEEEAPPVVEEENIFDNDNPTIEVALSWLGDIQIYKLRQHQKFKHLFKELASRNGLDENDITVDMYYNFVGPEDTPHSIGLKSFHTLTGHLTKSQNNNHVAAKNDYNPEALCRKPKKFQVKVQAYKWKHPLVIPMKKTDNFKIIFIKCAEELNCDPRSIKLFFDGDVLDPNDTPNNQDMEGNEVIDLKIKA